MEDRYIQLLRWGKEKSGGVTYDELTAKLRELGFPYKQEYLVGTLNHFTEEIFSSMSPKYVLNCEGYFQLLQYERLEEAREESLKATELANKSLKVATWSFWVAILTTIASAVIGILQLYKN